MRDTERYAERIIDPCMRIYETILWERNLPEQAFHTQICREREWLEQETVFAIPRIVIIVTTRCTLRCEGCSQLIPHYKKPYDSDMEKIISSMSKIMTVADKCYEVNILGGEAFLNKETGKLVEWLKRQEKVEQISFTTNGTVLPDEKMLENLRDERIIVRISDYGLLKQQSNFLSTLEQQGIHVAFESEMKWVDPGDGSARNRSTDELKKIYRDCNSGKACKTLLNGKLYHCSRSACLYDLGKAFPDESRDCLEICGGANEPAVRERMREFFLLDYSNACDNCDIALEDKKYISAGIQENKLKSSKFTIVSRRDYEIRERMLLDCREEINGKQRAVDDLTKMNHELRIMLADANRQIEEWKKTCAAMEADTKRMWDECMKTQTALKEELRKREDKLAELYSFMK